MANELVKIGMGTWVNPAYVVGVEPWVGYGDEEGVEKGTQVWTDSDGHRMWRVTTDPETVVQLVNRETYWTEDDDLRETEDEEMR